MTAPTFADVQAILFDIADAHDPEMRKRIYARHNPLPGGYSWETEDDFMASFVDSPPNTNVRLFDPLTFCGQSDDDLKTKFNVCPLVYMLAQQRMPVIRPDTKRRYATDAEIATIIAYLRSLCP